MKKFSTQKTFILEKSHLYFFECTDMPYLFKNCLININFNLPFFFG